MSEDNIDFRFLGRQVQILQGDVRDLRAEHLRLEGDVAGLKADLARMRAETHTRFEQIEQQVVRVVHEVQSGFKAGDARLEQLNQTMASNLQVLLEAIRK